MKSLTYRAASMPEALAKVQDELGPEALVIAAHKIAAGPAWQVWRKPQFEVLALPGGVVADHLEMAAQASRPRPAWPEPLAQAHRRLLEQGLEARLAEQLAAETYERLGPRALGEYARVREFLVRELAARLPIGEHLPRKGEQRLIVLVGVAGVGKTCAAAKLAGYAHYVLGRSAALISLDTFRVGALAQIQAFAQILRLPLEVAYTPADLSTALAGHADKDVILIDTPGRNPHRPGELVELAALLRPLPPARRVYLTASATAKPGDLGQAAWAFGALRLDGLLFTKMDETDTFGGLCSLALGSGLPASYFGAGPRVPEDIEPASAERLAGLLLNGRPT